RGAGPNHVSGDQSWLADGDDQNVRLPRNFGQVLRPAMTNRDCGVGTCPTLNEHQRDRFADNLTATQDNHVSTGNFDLALRKQSLDPMGRTRQEPRPALHNQPDILWMKCIDVLQRMDGVENLLLVDLAWKRQLD